MAAPLELQTDEVLQTAMVTLQDVYVYVCLYKILHIYCNLQKFSNASRLCTEKFVDV